MTSLPEQSAQFAALVARLERIVTSSHEATERAQVLALAEQRFKVERELLQLISPPRGHSERRKNVRVPCALEAKILLGKTWFSATVDDLSFSGMSLRLQEGAEKDAIAEVHLSPRPGILSEGLIVRGQIVWTKPESCGLQLLRGSGADRKLLLLVIELLKAVQRA